MNIILVGKFLGKPVHYQFGGKRLHVFVSSLVLAAIASLFVFVSYSLGMENGKSAQLAGLQEKIRHQKDLIRQARMTAQSDMDALMARIGRMQASVTRLNALGKRLISVSSIDDKEFDFDRIPALGGPGLGGPNSESESITVDFENVLGVLNEQLSSREQQLSLLEDIIMVKQLESETRPVGRPIGKGWISSYFGERPDPFTGKIEMHKGIDFASKQGSDVLAVANGVVTWSGKRYGYGNLVEISHGNGYVTRYGHNSEMLVKVGDNVKRGQIISSMGSTGRSTGPHVHFEVLKNDRQIDPIRFVQSKS